MAIEDGLPTIHADPLRIGEVLLNLVQNSIKFTPRGGAVTLTASRDAQGVRFAVSDTGVGVAPDEFRRENFLDGGHHHPGPVVVACRPNAMEARLVRFNLDDCPRAIGTGADSLDARNRCHSAQGIASRTNCRGARECAR